MAQTPQLVLAGEAFPPESQPIRYRGREAISKPFEVEIELSVPAAVPFEVAEALRSSVMLALSDARGERRFFHGIVDRAEYLYFTGTHHHFGVRLVPALAALAHRENCKIWQRTNVVDVAKEIFAEAGVDEVEWQLHHTHESREYIVQYRESELSFLTRLFEDEGIFYLFRHRPEGHTLVIADDVGAFQPADDAPAVAFGLSQGFGGEPLADFVRRRSLRTNQVKLVDFDFEKPQKRPEAFQPADEIVPMPFYGYPGGFTQGSVGQLMAKAHLRARRGDADVARGSSNAIGLRCGVPFSVAGAAQSFLDGDYVVTALETSGKQTLESGGDNAICENRFEAIPAGAEYMPPRRALRPRIRGVQTAVVTGPTSENQAIYVDKYGRIKVRFFWDRINQQDDTSSCWLRVVQVPTSGSIELPRVGWEMAVAFLEGDPDRPFALGRIYNGEKVPPASLPGAKATGGLKSYSTPGGAGINEIHLGDEGGSMGWTMNAQKDLNVIIEHDKNETIDVNVSHQVKTNANVTVGANETTSVGGNQNEDVGSSRVNKVGGSQKTTVGGNETNNATANMLEKVDGDRSYEVGGNMIVVSNTVMQTVSGNLSRKVGSIQLTASIDPITDVYGGSYTENVGAIKAELVYGTSSETVGGNKNATSIAAELHLVSGNYDAEGEGSVTQLVGGVHYQKLGGDLSVKGSLVTLLGATGDFKAGGGNLKLGGGPIVAKASKITAEATGILVKLGSSLKQG